MTSWTKHLRACMGRNSEGLDVSPTGPAVRLTPGGAAPAIASTGRVHASSSRVQHRAVPLGSRSGRRRRGRCGCLDILAPVGIQIASEGQRIDHGRDVEARGFGLCQFDYQSELGPVIPRPPVSGPVIGAPVAATRTNALDRIPAALTKFEVLRAICNVTSNHETSIAL